MRLLRNRSTRLLGGGSLGQNRVACSIPAIILLAFCSLTIQAELWLETPSSFIPDVPFLVRVEVQDSRGNWDRTVWNGEALLSVSTPGIELSTNRIRLRNGSGSALIRVTGETNFVLRAETGAQAASRGIRRMPASAVAAAKTVSGVLAADSMTWSWVVRVTADVTVPSGQTLVVQPGTWVLIDGVAAGSDGIDLIVRGAIRAEGTAAAPIVITCADPNLNWGQIRHENAAASVYRHVLLSKAGRAPGEGHTGTGPAIRAANSSIVLDACVVSDLTAAGATIGKIMLAENSALSMRRCMFARARMGPEIAGTGLDMTECGIMEMNGPDDADGIYLHAAARQTIRLTRCVLAAGDDDAVDTLDSTVVLEDCIIRDWPNPNEDAKGVSIFNGEVTLTRCLIVDCFSGVSAKSSGPLAVVRMDHCTIISQNNGVSAATKSNASAGNIAIHLANSIIQASDALVSDFGPDKFVSVAYCLLTESWSGAGNSTANPGFVNAPNGDFRLASGSPALNAGDPSHPSDADGSRADIGAPLESAASATASGAEPVSLPADPESAEVMISEIMYHPASEEVREEFIELHNKGRLVVNLKGWRLRDGVEFEFPDIKIPAGGYLVVAADQTVLRQMHPGIERIIGNWTGQLSNSRDDIQLEDERGRVMDRVRYADEGDWAVRQRGPLEIGHRGWIWFKEHDGLGKSLELQTPLLPNNSGQNWSSSRATNGTPGLPNSSARSNLAPLILDAFHFPIIPRSTDALAFTVRIVDEATNPPSANLYYRMSVASPGSFASLPMTDDGTRGDVVARDGIYTALLPPQINQTVIEYYFGATDAQGNARTWPAAAIPAADGAGPSGQVANALLQVDDASYLGAQPLYKMIMTEEERAELAVIPSQSSRDGPNAQMNATFISVDGAGTEIRRLVGVRNRGHGSRSANPPNYRVNFRSDEPWKQSVALNLNTVQVHLQHFGSVLALRSGAAGGYSQAVQVRVNNANRAVSGGSMFGAYAANEVVDGDWAQRHFPLDSAGNIYKIVRDLGPPNFNYRGTNWHSYTNTYFKETNASDNDWRDLIGMLEVMGENSGANFTVAAARQVVDLDQWITHLAVMNLLGNGESGLNTGNNDDYFMYRGPIQARFLLIYHDLDQILGQGGSLASNTDIFRSTCCPISGDAEGTWRTMTRLLRTPAIQSLYLDALRRLLESTFSKSQFDALLDQTLRHYVPQATLNSIKNWMENRRAYVQSQLPQTAPQAPPTAVVSAAPRSPTPRTAAEFIVGGERVTHYRYRLNDGPYNPEQAITTLIVLKDLPQGAHRLEVIARDAAGLWQDPIHATQRSWTVDRLWPAIRINEILAHNASVTPRNGGFPDWIELHNEGETALDLSGLRLTDDPARPNRYVFPSASSIPAGGWIVLDAEQLGFGWDKDGGVACLFDRVDRGGAQLDAVQFGKQIADHSIGRIGVNGDWALGAASPGGANLSLATGDPKDVRINEWLALGAGVFPTRFIELANLGPLPAPIGGWFLTDQPIGAPTRHAIAPLSFIPARGHVVFFSGAGAGDLSFEPAPGPGEIALLTPGLGVVDAVSYGSQHRGESAGRCPDGADKFVFLGSPTPGAGNQCPQEIPPPQTITLLEFGATWKYDRSGTDFGTVWQEAGFNDSAWLSGPASLGLETAALPVPLRTQFADVRNLPTVYFRTTFVFDPALAASQIEFAHLIDDGAAFYLNGIEAGSRFNLSATAGAATYASSTVGDANIQSFTIDAKALRAGTNTLAVEVHQVNATSSDLVFALELKALAYPQDAPSLGIVINEVLASNSNAPDPDGSRTDWIELFNPAFEAASLEGMSLTDAIDVPRRWIFPSGMILPPRGFLVIRCNGANAASGTNTGFGLSEQGGTVYLFSQPSTNGHAVLSSVAYGLQAADWSIGRASDGGEAWALCLPSPGRPNTSARLGDAHAVRINEWLANPAGGADWFELFNPSQFPVEISHFWLADDLVHRTQHVIAPLSFIAGGGAGYQVFQLDQQLADDAQHLGFSLNSAGDRLAFSDPNGVLVDGVSFGPQAVGVSMGRFPDGNDVMVLFPESPSPGSGNFLPHADILVNEILHAMDAPLEAAIEIHNRGTQPIALDGWFLSGSESELERFEMPSNTTVPAGGYRVFYAGQFGNAALADPPASSVADDGYTVYLTQAIVGQATGFRAFARGGPADDGVSWGRIPTSQGGDFGPLMRRTFGSDTPVSIADFRLGAGASNAPPKVGPVVISEIHYHPPNDNEALEFIELRNTASIPVALFDPFNPDLTWRIRGEVDFDLPQGLILPPGGELVLVGFNPQFDAPALAAFRLAYRSSLTPIGPYRGELSNARGAIVLEKPGRPLQTGLAASNPGSVWSNYMRVDHVVYADSAPWPALADGLGFSLHKAASELYGNDPAHWSAAPPSPGAAGSTDSDFDQDSMTDSWERLHGLDPANPADARSDLDGDGFSAAHEFQAGTDPNSRLSVLSAAITIDFTGEMHLEFRAIADRAYAIDSRDPLGSGDWRLLSDVPATSADRTVRLVVAPSDGMRFFRIRLQ